MAARIRKSLYDAILANADIIAQIPAYGAGKNVHTGEAPPDAPYPFVAIGPIVSDVPGVFTSKDSKARSVSVDIDVIGRADAAIYVEQLAVDLRNMFDSEDLVISGAGDGLIVTATGPITKPTSREYSGFVVTVAIEYEV